MEKDAAATGQSFMTSRSDNPWKAIAIALALILGAVFVFTTFAVTA